MIKFVVIVLMVIGLVLASPYAYQEYTIWDAKDSSDDESRLNELFLAFTPKILVTDVSAANDANLGVPIIDVRSVEEYDAGHIKGAISIPQEKLQSEFAVKFPEKNIKVYVYGSNNYSGSVSARLLRNMGYVSFNIINGLKAWEKAGFKTDKANAMYF